MFGFLQQVLQDYVVGFVVVGYQDLYVVYVGVMVQEWVGKCDYVVVWFYVVVVGQVWYCFWYLWLWWCEWQFDLEVVVVRWVFQIVDIVVYCFDQVFGDGCVQFGVFVVMCYVDVSLFEGIEQLCMYGWGYVDVGVEDVEVQLYCVIGIGLYYVDMDFDLVVIGEFDCVVGQVQQDLLQVFDVFVYVWWYVIGDFYLVIQVFGFGLW